ncbi:uncharacterized protein LOC114881280 [Osmia bicornis bicornis]|uniref:uncharacterized protein LOC114881280 n=1 Tax=Osmia bicornis bicornis TaxID=1437191 RepID=UPI0010F6CEF4|nr:uncharacterized protein LOC114881280 [Osmia bicornis bicornis]
MYVDNMCDVKEELKTVEFVCTTADIWSGRRRSFFGVTAHWITPNLKRKSAALACRRFPGMHAFDKITELLHNIHAEFGLNGEKIVATITDNASNFAKAFKIFGVKETSIEPEAEEDYTSASSSDSSTEEDDEEEESAINKCGVIDLLPRHIRCSAHTLNLCATTDMMQAIKKNEGLSIIHNDLLHKCNIFWKAAMRPKSAEVIQQTIGHALKRPGETRWNSLYDSLKQIVQIKDKLNDLGKSLGFKNSLKENDFIYLEEHLECTAPIAEAIDILQADNIFYGTLLPCLLSLDRKLTKLADSQWKFCGPISICLRDSFQRKFIAYLKFLKPEADYAALAALTHPQFKNKWLKFILEYHRNRLLDLFKNAIATELQCNEEYVISTPQPSSTQDNCFDFEDDTTQNVATEYSAKAELEVLHFFQERSTEYTILEKYAAIKKIFLKFNTPLPSSAPVERLFSYATITNSPKANRLSDSMFQRRPKTMGSFTGPGT